MKNILHISYLLLILTHFFPFAVTEVPLEKTKTPLYEAKPLLPKVTHLVHLEIQIESEENQEEEILGGRIVIALFGEVAPKMVENFKCLCTGEKGISKISGKPLHYKGSVFHRIIPNFIIQGGDITNHDGTGGECIYGPTLPYESPSVVLKHDRPYYLTMASKSNIPESQSSQFYINTVKTTWLDSSTIQTHLGQDVIIGIVVEGMNVIKNIERQGTNSGIPKRRVVIVDSGELVEPDHLLESFRRVEKAPGFVVEE